MIYLKSAALAIKAAVSWRDISMMIGLGLLSFGVSLVYYPAAFVVPGAILVSISIFGVR